MPTRRFSASAGGVAAEAAAAAPKSSAASGAAAPRSESGVPGTTEPSFDAEAEFPSPSGVLMTPKLNNSRLFAGGPNLSETRERTAACKGSSSSGSLMTPAPAESGVAGVDVEAAALAALASAAALFPPALTLSVPLVVRETLETSFLLAGGPKVLETRERTAAEIGSSSADAGGGGVDDELAGTPVNGAVTGRVPGDVAVVAVVAAAVDEAAPVVVAGVELERETPERLRTAPNLEIRSLKALSMAAVAADEEDEEESVRTGAATAGEEGGGEVSVEMEIPGIDVNMEAHEKLTAGVTNSESAEHGAQYSSPDADPVDSPPPAAPDADANVESASESEVAGKMSFEGFRV